MSSLSMGILIFLLSGEVERQKGRDGEQKFLVAGTECTYGGLFFDSSINYLSFCELYKYHVNSQ